MRIYIAGPISADPTRTIEEKIQAFTDTERALFKEGHTPINPTKVVPECKRTCVERTVFPDRLGQGVHSWECYMKADITALLTCDAIYPLNAWQLSPGARIEVELATALGIPWFARD